MADSRAEDTMVLSLGLLVPALIALIAGLVIHSFIIAVNVNDWSRGRSVTPVDQVVTSLGISRICNQCAPPLYRFLRSYFQNSDEFISVLTVNWMFFFLLYANIWLTSLLSIVFCLKISTLRTRLFLYLRRMIDRRTAHCIVALVLLSFINCLFLSLISLVTKGRTYEPSKENQSLNCTNNHYIYGYTLGVSIPLLFCCISSIFLFSSLYNHITNMKMSGNVTINLETYYSAMRFVSITFLYNIIYYTGHYVGVFYFSFFCVVFDWLQIALECLSALHSSYLIYRTAKLRSHMSKVLHIMIGFLFQRKDPETRQDIEVTWSSN